MNSTTKGHATPGVDSAELLYLALHKTSGSCIVTASRYHAEELRQTGYTLRELFAIDEQEPAPSWLATLAVVLSLLIGVATLIWGAMTRATS